jgi:hypothetical protein
MNSDGVAAAATNLINRNSLNEADDTKWRKKLGAGVIAYYRLNVPRMTLFFSIFLPILLISPLNVYNMLISGCCTILVLPPYFARLLDSPPLQRDAHKKLCSINFFQL